MGECPTTVSQLPFHPTVPRPDIRGMKTAVLLALLALGVSPGFAQEWRLYGGSGLTFSAGPGDLVEWWDRAPRFGVGVGRRFAERLEFTVSAGTTTLPISKEKLLAVGAELDIDGGDFTVRSVAVGLRVEFEKGTWFRPFLHLGAGIYDLSVSDLTIVVRNPDEVCPGQPTCRFTFEPAEREGETAPGLKLGAGIAYYISERAWLYAEPSYHLIFSRDRLGMVPLSLGVAYQL